MSEAVVKELVAGVVGRILHGQYSRKLDAMGRCVMPPQFRRDIMWGRNPVAMLNPNGCICLFPENVWEAYVRAIQPGDIFADPEAHKQVLWTYARSFSVALDDKERVQLPDVLLNELRMPVDTDVEIVGCRDHIQVWEKSRLDRFMGSFPDGHREAMKYKPQATVAAAAADKTEKGNGGQGQE
ncbi:MAG TPA: hypothetical protein PL033_16095 [Candidatus Brocadiia bacterium]|nr:hypothetical protein [Candidatus Brocadiia bacterium]